VPLAADKPQALIDEWRIIDVREGTLHLVGVVHSHNRIREGGRVVTSRILVIADDRSWAETENTLYKLGTPGRGTLPDEWARKIDAFLLRCWNTSRVQEE